MKRIKLLFVPICALLMTSCSKSLPKAISQDDWNSYRQYVDLSTGMRMSYVEMGDKNGTPIVMQHGTTDSSRSWSLVAPYFANKGYHIYMPELRGQGKSQEMDNHYTTFTYARDLNAFFDAMKIDQAICVGHSLGSFTMQTFWYLYPERVSKAILVSSIPVLGYQGASLKLMYDKITDMFAKEGKLTDAFMDWWYGCEALEPEIQDGTFDKFIGYMKEEARNLSQKAWTNVILGMLDTSFTGGLDGYNLYSSFDKSKPCLILHGSDDTMTETKYQQELIDYLSNESKSNVTYREYDKVGHNIQFTMPKKCSADILGWLETGKLPD